MHAAASAIDHLELRGPGDVNRVLQEHRFPVARGGWFTFLYHDPERRLREVRLLHGLRGYREPPAFEQPVPGVFALAFPAEGINRMEYRLAVVDGHGVHGVPDPLNPLEAAGPFGPASVALGLGYATPLHARPPRPEARGRLSKLVVPGVPDRLGVRHAVEAWVWDPPGVETAASLPIALVLDGTDYLQFTRLRDTLENLLDDGQIGPCRAVFVPPGERNGEYSANPALVEQILEAVPAALAGASIPVDVPWLGIGASLGGLALLHAHASRPGCFRGLLLQSGSFFTSGTDAVEADFDWFERITAFVEPVLSGEIPVETIPICLTCGAGGENLDNNRAMLAALRRSGVPAELALVADAHNWTAWRDCIGPGLRTLLPPR